MLRAPGHAPALDAASGREQPPMQLSARNQLEGHVKSVTEGTVMAEVIVDVAGQELVAAITTSSVERLGLREGVPVLVAIKATDVMIGTGG
jgi:molybdopterin-binding protein